MQHFGCGPRPHESPSAQLDRLRSGHCWWGGGVLGGEAALLRTDTKEDRNWYCIYWRTKHCWDNSVVLSQKSHAAVPKRGLLWFVAKNMKCYLCLFLHTLNTSSAAYLVQSVNRQNVPQTENQTLTYHMLNVKVIVKWWSDFFFTGVKFFSSLSCAPPDLYLLSHGPLPNHLTNLLHILLCCSNTAKFPATGLFYLILSMVTQSVCCCSISHVGSVDGHMLTCEPTAGPNTSHLCQSSILLTCYNINCFRRKQNLDWVSPMTDIVSTSMY